MKANLPYFLLQNKNLIDKDLQKYENAKRKCVEDSEGINKVRE